LAHLQPIGFRVFGRRKDFGDHDAVQGRAESFDGLHFQTDRGQAGGELIARSGDGDVFAQPAFGEFHRKGSVFM
jgi:hypothetical protein